MFDKIFIVMRNITGPPARGESFFPRNFEIETVLNQLDNGNNLQIAAPRRIGKTSILFHLLDNSLGNYVYVYVDTEAIDDENEFYKKLLKEIIRVEEIRKSAGLRKLIGDGMKLLKRVKSLSIFGQEIGFAEETEVLDYREDLLNLLVGLELEDGKQLVILLDEFPQTIQNIVDRNPGDLKAARSFLQSNRELRMNPEVHGKVKFIVTGSIGLNHTVAAIDSSAFINDLASIEVGALSRIEAAAFLGQLLAPRGLSISPEASDYFFERIEWLIPFHIQLSVQEMMRLSREGQFSEITIETIDKSFQDIVQARNSNHFEHYHSRLKKQFKGAELEYVLEVLDNLAEKVLMPRSAIYDISVKYALQSKWRHIVDVLVYDGYINNNGNHNNYRFNSPIVRMWWQRFICK